MPLSDLYLDLKDLLFPTRVEQVSPRSEGQFVRGINLGGDAVTIDGLRWEGYRQALGNGLATPGATAARTSVKPEPYLGGDLRRMFNTVVYRPRTLDLSVSLGNGAYKVYLWVMENHQSGWHGMELRIDGKPVDREIGRLPLGGWKNYGPYPAEVGGGELSITLDTGSDQVDAHLMGLSIYRMR